MKKPIYNNNYSAVISICIPTYNRPKEIQELLNSILTQSYTNFEIIITDNSNNSITENLIKTEFKDKRIKYFKNNRNLGMDGNCLKALSLISGDYFTFTPDDDIWIDKFKLEKQLNLIQKEGIECCFSNAHHIQKNGESHQQQFESLRGEKCKLIPSTDLLISNKPKRFVCILTALISTKHLEVFRTSWKFGSEELFMWYLGGKGETIGFCSSELVAIRDGEHNWQISDSHGTLKNFKKDRGLRAQQVFGFYTHLLKFYGEILINFDRKLEKKVAFLLVQLLGIKSVSYLFSFRKIHVGEKTALFLLSILYTIRNLYLKIL